MEDSLKNKPDIITMNDDESRMHNAIDAEPQPWHSGHIMARKPVRSPRAPAKRAVGQAEQGFANAKGLMAQIIAKADPESLKKRQG